MKPDRVQMAYHAPTKTTWVNDENREERHKTEIISYGRVILETDNLFEVKAAMNKQGFHRTSRNPFAILNAATQLLGASQTPLKEEEEQ